jgi:2-keto-4-pentenoate hydratase
LKEDVDARHKAGHDEGGDMNAWDDPRIARGMEKQFGERRARIAAGEKPLGWKVGLGAPPAMERLKIKAPLVGYMMQKSLLPNRVTVPVGNWHKPVAEPEVAVYVGKDLLGGADRATAAAAIGALGPAIELADLNPPPDDVEVTLAGNIFHRHVILGPEDKSRAGAKLDGLVGHVLRRGALAAKQDKIESLIGEMIGIVQHVAGTLGAFGEKLSAGDVIITGSIVPPPFIEPDETEFAYRLEPIGELSVRFSR